MSFLRSKHSGWGPDGRRTPFMGGGGGGQPTQSTSYNTNIPEYARPYVENMLESTQKQIYNQDMTGFRPYQAYSKDPNDYFAGFSPMQQQAQRATANLQTPGQFGDATSLAGASGLGSLGLAGQAAGVGQQFAQQAQNPAAMQGYMSPYMQNVVDYQKTQALRDYQIGAPMRARQAVGAGAFGGNRQALMEAEAQRSLGSQLQGIAATGSQKAFEDAQRQQQFGAQLGLQGIQAGLQGMGQAGQAAGTLGQLGQQQFGAQKDIINMQSQMGKEQQALEQSKINQQIQDYAIAQQYPFMQLGLMNAMLRGLPLQTQTTQLYQAQPSMLQQGIGLTGAASTLFGGRAAGGAIKEYREGGIVGYAPGGVIDSTRAKLEQIADMPGGVQKLEQIRNSSTSEEIREMATEIIVQKQMEAQAEQQAQKGRMSGIALAGGPAFESQSMAGGGIIAFAGQGPSLVPEIDEEGYVMPSSKEEAQSRLGMFFRGSPEQKLANKQYAYDQNRREEIGRQISNLSIPFTESVTPSQRAERQSEIKRLQNELVNLNDPNRYSGQQRYTGPMPTGTSAGTDTAAADTKADAKSSASQTGGGAPVDRGIAALTGRKSLEQEMREQERLMGPNTVNEGLNAKIAERLAGLSKQEKQDELAAIRRAFIEFGTTAAPGGMGIAALKGIGSYGDARDAAKKARESMDLELTKMQADIKKGERAEKRGNLDAAAKSYENAENRELKIAEMQNQLKVAGMQLNRPGELEKAFALFEKDPAKFREFIAAKDPNRGNLATATKDILAAKFPEYKLIAMTPIEKRTPEQNAALERMYKEATTEAERMLRGGSTAASGAKGQVDTKNPLLGT